MRFEDLRLIEPLLKAVRASGYETPTPIQMAAIPHVLAGRDVLGSAQTGTGKTAAFALPILQRLSEHKALHGSAGTQTHATHGARDRATQRHGSASTQTHATQSRATHTPIRTLVLCPTRELAQQIHDSFVTYGAGLHIRPAVVYGGVSQVHQVRALRAGVDVLIATPGRLLDLMGQGFINLSGIEVLVLDEADRMLDMGFMPDVRRILATVPKDRQTLLFSATMPEPIRKLADDILRKPVPVAVDRVSSPAPSVEHWVFHVEKPDKADTLTRLLANTPHTRALVFTRTKHGADKLTNHLVRAGVRAAALHGNKSQGARTRALAEFRSAHTPVLIATDIAARGLDVDDISHVINYDLTADAETYVHRIGRTGRAGASGTAVSFCTSEDHDSLRDIERLIREPLKLAADSAPPGKPTRPAPRQQSAPRHSDRKPYSSQPAGRSRRPAARGRGAQRGASTSSYASSRGSDGSKNRSRPQAK